MSDVSPYPAGGTPRTFIRFQDAVDQMDTDEMAAMRAILGPNKQIVGADSQGGTDPDASDRTAADLSSLPKGAVFIQCDAAGRPRGGKVTKRAGDAYEFEALPGRHHDTDSAAQYGPYLLVSVPSERAGRWR
ncbi:hypothetical protein E7744_14995 (plasmid) [Citricoccus sp. SGAir0253]|uniref:hypothetical protein n=1 Tax=Citricoccus sp. SGAir0253 TaxID=2567881 RepID=UPI0010CCFA43|nr:hypothetical protein [Citricoccus sp. SGAir0253]QCU79620.1 hypothetical protein E7744_14995 [Citricoccus sp. SGAir0253]